jgi:hypothetical protein
MVREAEAHAEADKINRERVEAINQAEVSWEPLTRFGIGLFTNALVGAVETQFRVVASVNYWESSSAFPANFLGMHMYLTLSNSGFGQLLVFQTIMCFVPLVRPWMGVKIRTFFKIKSRTLQVYIIKRWILGYL